MKATLTISDNGTSHDTQPVTHGADSKRNEKYGKEASRLSLRREVAIANGSGTYCYYEKKKKVSKDPLRQASATNAQSTKA